MALANGTTFGAYRVVDQLGRGGMASVYKAYEAALDRYVALKTLPPEFLHDETFPERFKREAKAVARLEHPNIVPIYAFGIEQGVPWMAMRLVPGGALSSVVKRGRLEPARAVAILKGTAEALTFAHAKGVVHRDVKPQNILLDEHERVYLADFGIAKMLEGGGKLTATGMITGTPQYMAPEQATGVTLDGRADTYALGIVAYELLTGRVPFAADTPVAILMKHVQERVPLPSPDEVKEPLVRAILKALAKKPADRWASPTVFVAALEQALHDAGTTPNLPTLPLTSVLTEVSPAASPTAAEAVPTATRPALPGRSPAATRPPVTFPTRPARLPTEGGTTVAATGRSGSKALVAALGFAGVAALVLAGVGAMFFLKRPAEDARATPTPLPSGMAVAPGPPASRPTLSSLPVFADAGVVTTSRPVPAAPPTSVAAAPYTGRDRPAPAAIPSATSPPILSAPPASLSAPTPPPAPAGPSPEVQNLMSALSDRAIEARWKAAEALGNLGEEASHAIPGLVQGLQDRSEVVRWRSAEALGRIGAAGAVGPLAAALKDRDTLVRTEAAKALSHVGPRGKEAVPALAEALSDSDVYCRRQAAKTLLSLAPESRAAVPALTQALKDKDKFVRLQSAKALGQIGPEARAADAALQAASKDSEPLVARAATEALRRIGGSVTQED